MEHAGRFLCTACLAKESAVPVAARRSFGARVGAGLLAMSAGVLLWVVFYGFGQFLKMIPPRVHEGTVWRGEDF